MAYILVTGLAMELLTNTIQIGGVATAMDALALILGYGWVGKLVVNGLDHPTDPLGPALVTLFARDEGVSLLGCVPKEGLDSVLGKVCVSAAVSSTQLPGEDEGARRRTSTYSRC